VDFGGWLRLARDEQAITLGALRLQPFTVPHDAREPLQLTCSDGDATLGILTDLGHVTGHVAHHLQNCTALLLECNHDPDMVALSAYPAFLKQRITGRLGHLANAQAAELLQRVRHGALRQVVAAHLSAQNNRPELARGHSQLRSAVRTATSLWRGPKKERTGSQADAGSGRRCKRRAHEKATRRWLFRFRKGITWQRWRQQVRLLRREPKQQEQRPRQQLQEPVQRQPVPVREPGLQLFCRRPTGPQHQPGSPERAVCSFESPSKD